MFSNAFQAPTVWGDVSVLSTVGAIKSHIRYLLDKLDREYSKELGFYSAARKFDFAKRFILGKAVEELTKQYPGTNGLLLLEAMDEIKKEMLKEEMV